MYDPSVGRWLTEDPIGFDAGDMDLYRYVGNEPTDLTDPTGLDTAGGTMVSQQIQMNLDRTLELEGLREQFPNALDDTRTQRAIQALQQVEKARQADVQAEEKKLMQLETLKGANAGNQNVTDLINKQIALQKEMIALRKAEVARVIRKRTLANEVNSLNKDANDYDRLYAQKELEFLRLLEQDLLSLDKQLRLSRELEAAGAAVNKAINP